MLLDSFLVCDYHQQRKRGLGQRNVIQLSIHILYRVALNSSPPSIDTTRRCCGGYD